MVEDMYWCVVRGWWVTVVSLRTVSMSRRSGSGAQNGVRLMTTQQRQDLQLNYVCGSPNFNPILNDFR